MHRSSTSGRTFDFDGPMASGPLHAGGFTLFPVVVPAHAGWQALLTVLGPGGRVLTHRIPDRFETQDSALASALDEAAAIAALLVAFER